MLLLSGEQILLQENKRTKTRDFSVHKAHTGEFISSVDYIYNHNWLNIKLKHGEFFRFDCYSCEIEENYSLISISRTKGERRTQTAGFQFYKISHPPPLPPTAGLEE